jgi:chromosome segregation ATPase
MNIMNNESSPKGLRAEWSLLVHSFLEENAQPALIDQLKASELSIEEIKVIKKELSSKRKKMNQSIEKIKIKIEQVSSVIENLALVGSDPAGLLKEIDFLSHEGEKISEEVMSLDHKIKKLHDLQDLIS